MKKGYCHCGCGKKTNNAPHNVKQKGWVKGEPLNYLRGHYNRKVYLETSYDIAENDCWEWKHGLKTTGYPCGITIDGKQVSAHRLMYEKHKGRIPKGKVIDHLCKNKKCVNPNHLEAVAQQLNVARGSVAKLNWNKVRQVRKMLGAGVKREVIATLYGVSEAAITDIALNRRWVI